MVDLVRLRPLRAAEYEAWLAATLPAYAADKARAGDLPADQALERARAEFTALLPQGLHTPRQHFLAIEQVESGEQVGVLWFAAPAEGEKRRVWVYDFLIFAPFRRRGLARAALRALEMEARRLGVQRIELHVFGHNEAARALYEQSGFSITHLNMARDLPSIP